MDARFEKPKGISWERWNEITSPAIMMVSRDRFAGIPGDRENALAALAKMKEAAGEYADQAYAYVVACTKSADWYKPEAAAFDRKGKRPAMNPNRMDL